MPKKSYKHIHISKNKTRISLPWRKIDDDDDVDRIKTNQMKIN